MSEPLVFVVDDDAAFRDSLVFLLRSAGLPAEGYADAAAFLGSGRADGVGCALTDLRMPGESGHDLQRALLERRSPLGVVFMSAVAELPDATRALRAGAVDFLEKPLDTERLLTRVREAIVSSEDRSRRAEAQGQVLARFELLTPREREVMLAVVRGCSNKVIATELGISARTVEIHRARVMEKMEADSLADLIRAALLLREDAA